VSRNSTTQRDATPLELLAPLLAESQPRSLQACFSGIRQTHAKAHPLSEYRSRLSGALSEGKPAARGFRSRNDALTAGVHPHVRW
jgi:hypothetical protein